MMLTPRDLVQLVRLNDLTLEDSVARQSCALFSGVVPSGIHTGRAEPLPPPPKALETDIYSRTNLLLVVVFTSAVSAFK